MLTENLWTEQGLVNGALRTVYDISWDADKDPSTQPPDHTLVQFNQYHGPSFINNEQIPAVVPIFKSTREFTRGNKICRRSQFPFTIAYAVTIHKAQGLTVDRAVLNTSRERCGRGRSPSPPRR
jgi:ATP-dependent DNA helicase PIF1